jgi:hypothetical protein
VAIEGYFPFERVDSLLNILFPFPLEAANLKSDVLSYFDHFTLRSALPVQDVNIHKAYGIGGTIVYFLNRQGGSNSQDEYSNN